MSSKNIILLLLILLFSNLLTAQKSLIRQAEKQYASHNFAKAAKLWQKAYEQTTDEANKKELAFRTGSAFDRMNRYDAAVEWFGIAIAANDTKTEWLLAHADACLKAGDLQNARISTQKALKADPYSSEAKRLKQLIENFENSQNLDHPAVFDAKNLNTEASDYSASWFNGDIVLSSSRLAGRQFGSTDGRTSEDFSALYLSVENLYGDFGPPIPLPVDQNKNVGVFSYNPYNKQAYFTRCNNQKQNCVIMQSSFDVAGFRFSRPKTAGFVQKKYHYGHPFVSDDGKTLYFSATLPGGYGGNDIYSISIMPDGNWGIPVNAGPHVNTAFDEVFPTLIGDSLLLFSTTGHQQGFGGLDIFAVSITPGGYKNLRILLPPFNSNADDFSLSLKKGSLKGVFTSNRNTAKNDELYFFEDFPLRRIIRGTVASAADSSLLADATIVCNNSANQLQTKTDGAGRFVLSLPENATGIVKASSPGHYGEHKRIVSLKEEPTQFTEWFLLQPMAYSVTAKGKVTERGTGMPMEGETVELKGPGGIAYSTRTNESGQYTFDSLQHDRIYTIRISGEGFFTESRVVRVPDIKQNIVLEKKYGYDLDFELTRIKVKEEIVLNDIYYDFDKAVLRENSKTELQKLASMLRETPGVVVQISSHTDERGTTTYNDKLSQERAQSVVDYLIASGISTNRLIAKGYGEQAPVFRNASDESQHQANRRTTFQVVDYNSQVVASSNKSELPGGLQQMNGNNRMVFRIQVLVSANKYDPEIYFSALKTMLPDLQFYVQEQGKTYKYEAGNRSSLAEAEALRNMIRNAGFQDCFIVPYIDGERVTIQQAKDFKP